MKKFLLVTALFVAFGLYAFMMRRNTGNTVQVTPATNPISTSSGSNQLSSSSSVGSNDTTNSPSSNSSSTNNPPTVSTGQYKDGVYTGPSVDAFYGNVRVQVTISGGKITDVTFLDYPQDRSTSIMINDQAMPILKQEAIQAQSANIDGASGASDTSDAFIQSLGAALQQAS